jgi:hypothetical protein
MSASLFTMPGEVIHRWNRRWAERLAGGVLWDVEYANVITNSTIAFAKGICFMQMAA